jgi:hypothetical protein
MQLAFTVIAVVTAATIVTAVVGLLIDRGTERHANKGNRQ